jgi:hypothetical protein
MADNAHTHHVLAIGGLGHALAGGHIDKETHDKGVASARQALAKAKAAKAKTQATLKKVRESAPPPANFGSLAPVQMPPKPPLEWNGR